MRSPMEKRKCPRSPVMLPAVFLGERAGGGIVVRGCARKGFAFGTWYPAKGDYVRIRIELIGETLTGDLAVVRWSREEEFGVELIRMALDQQARLGGFLNLFSSTPVGVSTTTAPE